MQVRLTTSIWNYFESLKAFRGLNKNKFYYLVLCSSTLLLFTSDTVSAVVVTTKIAQATNRVVISRPTLKLGSQGEQVTELQAALKLLGFYSGAVDGIYTERTATAVSQFKRAVELIPDGIVDPITWQKLFPLEPIVIPTVPGNQPSSNLRPNFPITNQILPTSTVINSTQPIPASPPPGAIPGVQYTSQGLPILRPGMRNSAVRQLQKQLKQLGFFAGDVDGDFGIMTAAAVKSAQQHYGMEADGVVGGATWEALLRR
jgi:peptidoglycan hydrolase-like protein with peptidoglycan-binding domain